MTRTTLFTIFFFAAFLFLLSQLYAIFESFLGPIAWSIILALVFYPTYRHALRLTGGRRGLAAGLITTAVFLLVAIPMGLLSGVLAREGAALFAAATQFFENGGVTRVTAWLTDSAPGHLVGRFAPQLNSLQIDLTSLVQSSVTTAGNTLVGYMGGIAKNVATGLIDLFIVLFTLFFLFRDGDRMYRALRDLIPMDPKHKDAIFSVLYQTLSAVTQGMVVTAVAQGVLTWVALWGLGLPYTAFLGVLAGFLSLVPFVGAAGVWIPATIYLAAIGDVFRALILLVYGSIVISMVDNVLRPLLIGGQTRLPTLFLFFGILGGVQTYGVLGIFLGPVLLAIVIAFIRIYQEQFATPEAALPPPV